MESESSNQRDSSSRPDLSRNSGGESITDMSSLDMDRTIAGRFEGHLYHVLPAGMKVIIQFVLPILFKDFMGLLEKEFDKSTCTLNDRFSVTSHIQGRSVTITVLEARRTIEVSGPGHKLWKEITFKRIANTLFTRFIHNFSIDLQGSINTTNVQPQMTSTPMVTRPMTASGPAEPPAETSGLQGTPVERQMAAVLESLAFHSKMITTLQEQLTNLTTEVLKLQQQPPVTKATTEENVPATRSRTFSVLSVESESSSIQSADLTQSQSVDKDQTPTLPKSKSRPKKLGVGKAQQNQGPQKSKRSKVMLTTPKTLIIGDSIINGINPRGLKNYVHCSGISGATVETVHEKMSVYNLKNFTNVIIYVGGNDVSNGSNVEYVEEKYDQLLQYIKDNNGDISITLCTVCPRKDADVTDLNEIVTALSEEYSTQLVETEKYFCTDENPVMRYYGKDQIHLSKSGIRRLLDCIEKSNEGIVLVENYELCAYGRSPAKNGGQNRNRRNTGTHTQRGSRRSQAPTGQNRATGVCCVKCGETNHSTFQCKHKTQIKCHDCGFLGHKQSRCPNK